MVGDPPYVDDLDSPTDVRIFVPDPYPRPIPSAKRQVDLAGADSCQIGRPDEHLRILADNGAMVRNRSVPTDAVLPHLYYRDADAAAVWLADAFGFREVYRVRESDGRIHIAQLRLGNAYVMIRYERDASSARSTAGGVDAVVDGHRRRRRRPLRPSRGSRGCAGRSPSRRTWSTASASTQALDLDGHRWTFAQHIADVDPAVFTADPA